MQSINITSTAPGGAVIGGSYTIAATASSGLAVTFTADGSSAGICTVAGSTVTFVGAGTCTIDANQAGNGSYQAAPQVQQSFAISRVAQTITFTSAPPGGATVGGATYTVSGSASSGLAVTFSIAAGSAGVCTLAGSTVSFVGAGTCTIDANQAGNGSYQAATQVTAVVHRRERGAVATVDLLHLDGSGRRGRRRRHATPLRLLRARALP